MCDGEAGCQEVPGLGSRQGPSLASPLVFVAHLAPLPLQGASANWWNHRHFQHHAKPNIFHKDPDIKSLHVFVLGEWQPLEV